MASSRRHCILSPHFDFLVIAASAFHQAIKDGLRHALLAKLAQEASCMYKSAAAWASRMLDELPVRVGFRWE